MKNNGSDILRQDRDSVRIFGLDAARGFMMLLGVFVHSLIFVLFFGNGETKVTLTESHAIFGTFFTLHSFRMPAFFFLAGYFASLLIAKRGSMGFAHHRAKRLGLVFLIFGPVIVPITHAVVGEQSSLESLNESKLNHLWFLYYLIILTSLMFVLSLVPTLDQIQKLKSVIGNFISDPRILWVLPLALFPWLKILDESGRLRTSESFIPDLPLLFFYGLFFALGTFLFKAGDAGLEGLSRRSYFLLLIGLISAQIGYGWGFNSYVSQVNIFCAFLASFYLAFGVIGVFLRQIKHENKIWNYLTKTSYWVYLVHLPIVFVFLNAFGNLSIPILVKVILTFICTSGMSFLGYEIIVRRTLLAKLL